MAVLLGKGPGSAGAESAVMGGEGRVSGSTLPMAAGKGAFVGTVCLCAKELVYLNACCVCWCENRHAVLGWRYCVDACRLPYSLDVGC